MDLPASAFEACDQRPGRVSSQALVRYPNNDHSVPVAYAHREMIVEGYVEEGVIVSGGEEIARHRRSYETANFVL
ncbi:MAG: IS21 family transposase, partial [Pseudomonadota bacterium]